MMLLLLLFFYTNINTTKHNTNVIIIFVLSADFVYIIAQKTFNVCANDFSSKPEAENLKFHILFKPSLCILDM